jgi:hypothetical protein
MLSSDAKTLRVSGAIERTSDAYPEIQRNLPMIYRLLNKFIPFFLPLRKLPA